MSHTGSMSYYMIFPRVRHRPLHAHWSSFHAKLSKTWINSQQDLLIHICMLLELEAELYDLVVSVELSSARQVRVIMSQCLVVEKEARQPQGNTWNRSLTHLPLGQNGHHFADDVFNSIYVNDKFCILIKCHWSLFLRVQLTITQNWFR